jgi:GT2 family glycosyltransferase
LKVCAVIVTYGERFHLLKQVMDACYKEGVSKIIVVDNNSSKSSKIELKKYEKENKDKLKVIYLNENTGSAGGYKRGLEEGYKCNECEYILLLDDDNLIIEDSMNKVGYLINYLESLDKNFMLSFFRGEREDNNRIIKEGWIKGYKSNNFNGLNFLYALKNKFIKSKKNNLINLFPLQPIEVAAMGGTFFHKSILEKLGYPDEDFYLYADDHDFTYRFTKSGGHIFLCSELKLEDIDSTTISDEGKEIGFFDEEFPEFKMYYQVRNHTYFSKNFINNKILFYGNMIVYLLLYFKKILKTPKKLFFRRYSLLLRAINDGLSNKLGRTF